MPTAALRAYLFAKDSIMTSKLTCMFRQLCMTPQPKFPMMHQAHCRSKVIILFRTLNDRAMCNKYSVPYNNKPINVSASRCRSRFCPPGQYLLVDSVPHARTESAIADIVPQQYMEDNEYRQWNPDSGPTSSVLIIVRGVLYSGVGTLYHFNE